MTKVLFICLGNICRSTMAEAVLRHLVGQRGLDGEILVDSAGTSRYHLGEPPHRGTRKKLEEQGISWAGISGRQVTREDLEEFDLVIAMDRENLEDLKVLDKGRHGDKLFMLSDFAPGKRFSTGRDVPDPWYDGNFDQTFQLVEQGCLGILDHIQSVAR